MPVAAGMFSSSPLKDSSSESTLVFMRVPRASFELVYCTFGVSVCEFTVRTVSFYSVTRDCLLG